MGSCIFCYTARVRFGFVKFSNLSVRVRFGSVQTSRVRVRFGFGLDPNPGSTYIQCTCVCCKFILQHTGLWIEQVSRAAQCSLQRQRDCRRRRCSRSTRLPYGVVCASSALCSSCSRCARRTTSSILLQPLPEGESNFPAESNLRAPIRSLHKSDVL